MAATIHAAVCFSIRLQALAFQEILYHQINWGLLQPVLQLSSARAQRRLYVLNLHWSCDQSPQGPAWCAHNAPAGQAVAAAALAAAVVPAALLQPAAGRQGQ
jgi:hypothetical protein